MRDEAAKEKPAEEKLVVEEKRVTHDEHGTVEVETVEVGTPSAPPARARNRNILIVALVTVVALVAVYALFFRPRDTRVNVKNGAAESGGAAQSAGSATGEEAATAAGDKPGMEVTLPPEALAAAGIEYAGVTQRPAVALLKVTGAVEANPQQTQAVTPLVAGRVESVNVVLGDRVGAGTVLARIASPQIAELQGQLGTAETRLRLAQQNAARVQRAENRVAVLSARAKLDEAEATLRRTRRLVELGAGAGKDLIAAEAAYRTAKAEYDFQSNISLSREVQEAKGAVETAQAEVAQIRQSLSALGAPGSRQGDGATVTLRAPAAGIVTERMVNAGAGVEVGKPLFTIANISTVWVIANVPEAQVGSLRVGTPAEVRSAALGTSAVAGRVAYIDPALNEETRTARVRVEVANPGERLKVGMFTEVGFQAGTNAATGEELMVPSEAVQRVGDRAVVFVPEEKEPGHFEVRDVELGGESGGYRVIISGLRLGERVVTKGSFTLKSQMMKGSFGEDDDK